MKRVTVVLLSTGLCLALASALLFNTPGGRPGVHRVPATEFTDPSGRRLAAFFAGIRADTKYDLKKILELNASARACGKKPGIAAESRRAIRHHRLVFDNIFGLSAQLPCMLSSRHGINGHAKDSYDHLSHSL